MKSVSVGNGTTSVNRIGAICLDFLYEWKMSDLSSLLYTLKRVFSVHHLDVVQRSRHAVTEFKQVFLNRLAVLGLWQEVSWHADVSVVVPHYFVVVGV